MNIHVEYHSRLWMMLVEQGMTTHEVYVDEAGRPIAIMVPARQGPMHYDEKVTK